MEVSILGAFHRKTKAPRDGYGLTLYPDARPVSSPMSCIFALISLT